MMINRYIGQNILIIEKHMKSYLRNVLKKYELNAAEALVLLVLFDDELPKSHGELRGESIGMTQEQLIYALHYDKGVMTRTMQALESKKFVTRHNNKSDGRSFVFMLTEKAYTFKPYLMEVLKFWNNRVLADLSGEDINLLGGLLEKISKASKKLDDDILNR